MPETEKQIERKLVEETNKIGGKALKLSAMYYTGLPDRICLFPGGRIMFVEVKSPGKRPRKIQLKAHKMLRDLGFRVEIIDSSEMIVPILKFYG